MIFAQLWTARYNGTGDSLDGAYAIAIDGSGNVYVTGRSFGIGVGEDYVTIKYNATGGQQWAARYNGPVGSYDNAVGIALDTSGNVYVTGRSYGVGTYYDYATVKYNAAGGQQWVERYNGSGNNHDEAKAICVDRAGNIYVTGRTYDATIGDDYTTIKYSAAGTQQWVARYNGLGNGFDEARGIAVDTAGNVYVTGASFSGAGADNDYETVKYDTAGNEQWVRRYNGFSSSTDEAYAIVVDNAYNVYVTGVSYKTGMFYDYHTIKYNTEGTLQWQIDYGGPGSGPDYAYALDVDDAGNVYVTGRSYDPAGLLDYDYATVKYDTAGAEQWVRRYNGPGDSYDEAYAVAVDNAGNVYVTGRSVNSAYDEDYATVKYTSSGTQQWVGRYNGPGYGSDVAYAVAVDSAGNIYVTGESFGIGTDYDYATLKYSYTVAVAEQVEPFIMDKSKIGCRTSIISGPLLLPDGHHCRIFDIAGREIAPAKITRGVYFLQIDNSIVQKIIKVR
jgi:uncharacterized delta-60 repeat protein